MLKYILLVLAVQSTFALFEETNLVRPIKNFKGINRLLFETDFTSIVLFYSSDCEVCQQAGPLFEKVASDNADFFKVFGVDCDVIWEDEINRPFAKACDPKLRQGLPQVSFYQPPPVRINPQKNEPIPSQHHPYEGEASPRALAQFGFKLIPPLLVRINTTDQYNLFLSREPKLNKVVLFTEKKITSPLYKQLSLTFFERLHFGEVLESKDTQEVLDEFEIETFPQLYILHKTDKEFTKIHYSGELKLRAIKNFLEDYASTEPIKLENPEEVIPQLKAEKEKEQEREKSRRERREQEDKEKEKLNIVQVKTLKEETYEKELLVMEKPVLLHLQKGNEKHPQWEAIQKKYKNLFEYYEITVDEYNEKFVKEQIGAKQQFPIIRFFVLGNASRKRANKIFFSAETDLEEINKDISDLVIDKTYNVNEMELQSKFSTCLSENKVCLVYFYDTPVIGLTYRVVSSLSMYDKKYTFISMKNPPEKLYQQFQIKQLPYLAAVFRDFSQEYDPEEPIKQEDIRMAAYTDKMQYAELTSFLNVFTQQTETKKSKKSLYFVDTQQEFEQQCESLKSTCFIALLNGQQREVMKQKKKSLYNFKIKYDGETATKWDAQVAVLEKLKDKYGQSTAAYIYLDAACHSEVLQSLDLPEDELPNYIAYVPLTKKYAKMIGRFDFDSLDRFVENFTKGKTSVYKVQQDLKLKTHDCKQIFERRRLEQQSRTNTDDDDDILKEILEEERKKREEFEKEFNKDKKGKKKGKKKKDIDDL